MNKSKKIRGLSRALVVLAAASAYGSALAQEGGGLAPLATSESSVSVGLGVASGDSSDRARFGLYNGLRKDDANLLFGFNYRNRDESSGKWLTINGRNIGLDNREFGASYRWLGDMKFNVDYSEIVRHDPRTINTSLSGAGTTTPTVSLLATPGTGQDLNLELKRKGLGFNFEKMFGNYQVEVSFKNEEKEGARFFGKGFACSTAWANVGACTLGVGGTAASRALTDGASAVLMLPEPVNSVHRQFEAKLNYSGQNLRLSGGYYGSFYTNRNGNMTPTIVGPFSDQNGGANPANAGLATTMGLPMALAPDNQAHQLSLAGNYTITPKTRINFKYAYTHATQNESFGGMGLSGAPAGRSDFGGVINTTKAQVGFSAHPLDKLHVHGDLAYDEKKNKSPIDFYNTFYTCPAGSVYNATTRACVPPAARVAALYTNGNASPKKWDAKLEASYRLPQNFLLVGGLKYEREDFGTWTPTDVAGGVTGLKQKLAETSYRVELRKTMSDTFTGSVSYVSARREGKSPWLQPNEFQTRGQTGVTEVSDAAIYSRTAIFPFIYMNRQRDKVRLTGNWEPVEKLSLQLFWDGGKDTYSAPTEHGLRSFKMGTISLDATYTVSDDWKVNAYTSRGRQTIDSGHSTGYDAVVRDTATSLGMGFKGTPTARLKLGGDLMWINDKLTYTQTADALASAANVTFLATSGGLPDVTYRMTKLNFYGEYTLQKNAYVRLDYVYYHTFFNEWTYRLNGVPFLYSDNTTLSAKETQSVSFIGASYVYKFQ